MKRDEAIALLKDLEGQDLHALASQFGVTVVGASGKVNKGWAGHVCERYLGLPINSSRSPNFGSWELKSIPLKRKSDGSLAFKETMAITMIDPWEVKEKEFEDSHLYAKLRKAVCVARVVGKSYADPAFVHAVVPVDLKGEVLRQVQADYDEVRACLLDPNRGFEALTGRMGQLVQPRTKGAGHGSISRAFYARPAFLAQFIAF